MLLIPLPLSASRGDQIQNAESFVKRGIAAILYQEDLLVDSLKAAIDALEEERPHMLARLREISPTQGTMNVLREMENVQK
jgi:UDP-N-acetylglucosamine--N-acetylmuramyl-(pentapeptide) pyrophosphoryl-undecaprenol N-acetylglucosamine transferase